MANPDIGLTPPKAGNLHSRAGRPTTTGMKFGMVVVADTTDGGHDAITTTTTAADTGVVGVITSQGDPNNSGQFAVGDECSVRDLGDVELLVLGGTAYNEKDLFITSTTAGVAKKLEAETGSIDLIGRCLQSLTTGSNPQRVSCKLNIQRVKL